MNDTIEHYKNCQRFNGQYPEIYSFLLEAEQNEYNEHFPWGRFEWMHIHTMLDEEKLPNIAMFRDESGKIVGLLTHDTFYDDRVYLLHTVSDEALLNRMVDTALEQETGDTVIKVNAKDDALIAVLQKQQFNQDGLDATVLELDLSKSLTAALPNGYSITPLDFVADAWQYQLMIHNGFDNEGIPEPWKEDVLSRGIHPQIKAFAVTGSEYCAHCGMWYTEGDSAYIEPVATVPEHRKKGLAKAAVFEACRRAKTLGAKRATVISDQEFYYRIGFTLSSEVYRWKKERNT